MQIVVDCHTITTCWSKLNRPKSNIIIASALRNDYTEVMQFLLLVTTQVERQLLRVSFW